MEGGIPQKGQNIPPLNMPSVSRLKDSPGL